MEDPSGFKYLNQKCSKINGRIFVSPPIYSLRHDKKLNSLEKASWPILKNVTQIFLGI